MSTFFINTLEEVKKIPYGSTMSYKDIANNIKSPKDIEQLQMQMLEILSQ